MPLRFLKTIVCLALVWLAGSMQLRAQDADVPSRAELLSDPVYLSWVTHPGVTLCVSCHIQGPPVGSLSKYSRRQEMLYWLRKDKHAIARRRVEPLTAEGLRRDGDELADWLLEVQSSQTNGQLSIDVDAIKQWFGRSNELSRRICDKLYGDGAVETPAGYAAFRSQCLTCHGGYQDGAEGFAADDPVDKQQLGIDCLYCHQNENGDAWASAHQKPDNWRLLAPDAKAASGMVDLANTANQTRLCFECHVGNPDKGMFVTHEMYAAGHPPLPSIEAQTFCREMPQHWQTPGELFQRTTGDRDQAEFFATNYPGLDPTSTMWNTRKLLVGALGAKQQQLEMLIQASASDHWADYALYDCAACHHELKTQSLRQERTLLVNSSSGQPYFGNQEFRTAPGRPRQLEWTQSLLAIAYQIGTREQTARAVELHQDLDRCFSDQPFGDAMRVKPSAEALRDQIGELVTVAEGYPITPEVARKVLGALAKMPREALLTYDAGRQVVWAMQVIAGELEGSAAALPSEAVEKIGALGDADASGIQAGLPSGRSAFIYPEGLAEDLALRRGYDVDRLVQRLREVDALLD